MSFAVPITTSAGAPALAQRLPRIAGLDGLRGLAILVVMLNHYMQELPATSAPVAFLVKLLQGNWGISLFMVLSGFLVTGVLLDSREKPNYLRNFHYGRALRIMPLYFAVLVFVFLIVPEFVYRDSAPVRRLMEHEPWMWVFGMNIPMMQHGAWIFYGDFLNLTHLWSISAQEQFYWFWPLVILLIPRKRLLEVCLALIFAALALRLIMYYHGTSAIALYTFTPCRVDTLAVGALLAILARRPDGLAAIAPYAKWLAVAAGTPLVIYFAMHNSLYWHEPFMGTLGYSLQAALCGSLLVAIATFKPAGLAERLFTLRPLKFLAKYSYGLFVLHMLFFPLTIQHASRAYLASLTGSVTAGWVLHTVLALAASMLAAFLSYHLFEKHFLVLKDLLKRVPVGTPVPVRVEK